MRWISLIGSVLRMKGRCDRRSNPCSKVVHGSLIGRLVPEHAMTGVHQNRRIVVDGALMDNFRLTHGYWEAKDEDDDLPSEVVRKFEVRLSPRQHPFPRPVPRHPLAEWAADA